MNLYIVRYAVAYKRDADRWPDDAKRPLTPEGEERFRWVARGILRLVPEVGVVLSSPFVRAWRGSLSSVLECTGVEPRENLPELTIPERYHAGFASIARLEDEPFQAWLSVLRREPPAMPGSGRGREDRGPAREARGAGMRPGPGFYLAEPLPSEAMLALLADSHHG
jgi:broad specificity phosphatase PhoE